MLTDGTDCYKFHFPYRAKLREGKFQAMDFSVMSVHVSPPPPTEGDVGQHIQAENAGIGP
jgi:hypothetical protein